MATTPCIAEMINRFIILNYPKAPADDVLEMVVVSWQEDLADLPDADLRAACAAYRKSIDPADRWWPQPGRLIALSPIGRALTVIGSDDDSARAFTHFRDRMRALAFRPSRATPAHHLDPADPYRNDAMFAALEAYGGPSAWGMRNIDDPFRVRESETKWRGAYKAAREGQRHDREAVAFTAGMIGTGTLMLGVKS